MKIGDIEELRTIGSQFDNNSVIAFIGEEAYRIKVTELIKLLDPNKELMVKQPRKHKYLELKTEEIKVGQKHETLTCKEKKCQRFGEPLQYSGKHKKFLCADSLVAEGELD